MQELSCGNGWAGLHCTTLFYDTTNYNHYYSMIGFMTPQILLYFNGDIFISTIQVTSFHDIFMSKLENLIRQDRIHIIK